MSAPLLEVRDLTVHFPTHDGTVRAVDGISYDLRAGETLGIVGESGSGKSVSSLAVMGLLPKTAQVTGSIRFRGEELIGRSEKELQPIRGAQIAMIFQDALASLNPVHRVGDQIVEAMRVHGELEDRRARERRAVELLDIVGIPDPATRVSQYPHEYSGGMRQRAMIAMALANDPAVLFADEPTTALDVTIQAQVLDVVRRVQERTDTAVVLITHDLGVVAGTADRVMVMYAGRQAELGTVDEIFYETRHPYTAGLLASLPRLDRRAGPDARLYRIEGQPPSLVFVPPGCPFHPRCTEARTPAPCATDRPDLTGDEAGHQAACHFPESARRILEAGA
ncbi:MAG: ABC transporter ATP-binding protein [Actinomycetes bacterium]